MNYRKILEKIMRHHVLKAVLAVSSYFLVIFLIYILFTVGRDFRKYPELSRHEKDWLDRYGSSVYFTPDPEFAPFEFYTGDGTYNGIAADILKEIGGALRFDFKTRRLKNWTEILDDIKNGSSAGVFAIIDTEPREEFLYFTEPYIKVPLVIITDEKGLVIRDLDRNTFGTIATTGGYIYEEYLEEKYPDIDFIKLPSDFEGLRKVSYGEIDAMIVNLASASWIIQENGFINLSVCGDVGYQMQLSIGISKKYPELYSIINKAFKSISSVEIEKIFSKWITLKYPWYKRYPLLFFVLLVAGILLLISILVLVFIFFVIRLLRRSIAEKTNLLRTSREYLRALIEVIPDPLFVKNSSHVYTLVNKTFASLLGKKPEDIIGRSEYELFPDTAAFFIESDNFVLEKGGLVSYEDEYTDFQGVKHVFVTKKTSCEDHKGEKSVVAILNDITRIREKENELIRAQKMEAVGNLASGLAHDFNNALMGIDGSASLIEFMVAGSYSVKSSEVIRYLEVMKQSSTRAREIVQRLLSLSRKSETVFKPLAAGVPVKNVFQTVLHSFDKRVEITLKIFSGDIYINGDKSQIEQVLLNLLINAYHAVTTMRGDFEKWGGKIEIIVTNLQTEQPRQSVEGTIPPGDYCSICIKDNGVGIDGEKMNKIFTPFYSTKKDAGSGLGLSMVLNIVKKHNGFVLLSSEPGQGSCFTVYIPLIEKPEEASAGPETTLVRGEGSILVIDDDDNARDTTLKMLQICGYKTESACDGKSGLEILEENEGSFSAVILDYIMPGIPSVTVYREMRKKWPSVKVLLVSGFSQDEGVLSLIEEGVDDFLSKPFTLTELSNSVHRILKQ